MRKQFGVYVGLGLGLMALPSTWSAARAAEFVVDKTADTTGGVCSAVADDCSLREAITAANGSAGADRISFAIPAAQVGADGAFTIAPTTALPDIVQQVTIDGYTQAGATRNTLPLSGGTNAVLKIVLNGTATANGARGLSLVAGSDNSIVRGLVINGFASSAFGTNGGAGIAIDGANGVTVEGCFLGTNAAGSGPLPVMGIPTAVGGSRLGIAVVNANDTLIGGTSVDTRNLISDNVVAGINISNVAASNTPNRVLNNLVGTNASGVVALPNGTGTSEGGLSNGVEAVSSGVFVADATGTLIGGPNGGNVISGNAGIGVVIRQSGTTIPSNANQILSNLIGVAANGTTPLGNTGDGIEISSAQGTIVGAVGQGNRIQFNTGDGIAITGTLIVTGGGVNNSRVVGNVISNSGLDGVLITGGVGHTLSQNSIFDNVQEGIDLTGDAISLNDLGDGDTGPNNLQNFPVLTGATTSGNTTTLRGTLDSAVGNYRIEFFANLVADTLGNGEGRTFLGDATTAGGGAAFAGDVTIPVGQFFITATATNTTTGDTSEFSTALTFNQPPVNSVPATASTSEDTPLVFSAANGNAISVSDGDAGNNPLNVTLNVSNGVLTLSQTTGLVFSQGDGINDATMIFSGTIANINAALNGLRFDPTLNANGGATLSLTTVDQGAGGSSGPQQDSDSVAITIAAVNDTPDAVNDSANTNEDVAVDIAVLANDVDIENTALTVTAATAGANTNGTLVINANNTVRFTPNANFSGTATFTYTISDGALSDSATVTVQVLAVNDAPVATPQNLTTNEDTALAITLTGSDIEGSALTFAIVSGPQNGTLSGSGANLVYTPNANFSGSDSFTFRANDGINNSAPATIALQVLAANNAPVATPQNLTTNEDTALSITLGASDLDAQPLTFSIVTPPQNGTLSGSGANVIYTPNANFNGSDSFTFKANDGTIDSNVATVNLQVLAVNDAPFAANNRFASAFRVLSIIAPEGLLINDSDIEGSPLTARLVVFPTKGTVVVRANGSFIYTPFPSVGGFDSFSYVANDGSLDSNVATVQITIGAARDRQAPSVTIDTPRNGSVLNSIGVVQGLVSDPPSDRRIGAVAPSGVRNVRVLIVRLSDEFTWNGRAFVATPTLLPTTLTGTRWRLSVPSPTSSDLRNGVYQVVAIATDNAGNQSRKDSFVRVIGNSNAPAADNTDSE